MSKKDGKMKIIRNKKTDISPMETGSARKRVNRESPRYGAAEKCRAVLSVWTEKRKPGEVCRELDIPYMVLSHWQNRALEGMLQALEPRVRLDRGPALSPRLQALLEKRSSVIGTKKASGKLEERLARIQGGKEMRKSGSPPNL